MWSSLPSSIIEVAVPSFAGGWLLGKRAAWRQYRHVLWRAGNLRLENIALRDTLRGIADAEFKRWHTKT